MAGNGVDRLLKELETLGDQAPRGLLEELVACGARAVPPLIDVLKNPAYWEAEDERAWMPLHAAKALGRIGAGIPGRFLPCWTPWPWPTRPTTSGCWKSCLWSWPGSGRRPWGPFPLRNS